MWSEDMLTDIGRGVSVPLKTGSSEGTLQTGVVYKNADVRVQLCVLSFGKKRVNMKMMK